MNKIHGSLFSGIGGFDLAAEWMEWQNAFHCEINPFCQQILTYYWPNATSYHDITKTDFTVWRGRVDVLTGGFPCQPFSLAGKREGAEDDRYLWPEMLRAIAEICPTWIIGENVVGITSMVQPDAERVAMESQTGLFSEDNDEEIIAEAQQFVTETICQDLESLGYSIQPFVIPACAVGAPHRRDRIWFVAHSNNNIRRGEERELPAQQKQGRYLPEVSVSPRTGTSSNAASVGLSGRVTEQNTRNRERESGRFDREHSLSGWEHFPTQPAVCVGDDGFSANLDFAAVFGSTRHPRQPARAFGKWRNESIKGGGNAVVPQVVLEFFKAIERYESELGS